MGDKESVFVVMVDLYDCLDPIKAFRDKTKAEAFISMCKEYDRKKPTILDEWREWNNAHPAGAFVGAAADSYNVYEIPLE